MQYKIIKNGIELFDKKKNHRRLNIVCRPSYKSITRDQQWILIRFA
jgi:hypothetical protein